jgi:hypothetical protein
MLIEAVLLACLANEPQCKPVQTYETMDACQDAARFLAQSQLAHDYPVHCEPRKDAT